MEKFGKIYPSVIKMNYPAAELRGIKSLKVEECKLASVYLMIYASLLPNIFFNNFLVAILTYRIGVISARPKFPTPELFLHLRVNMENLFGGNAFNDLNNGLW